MTFHHSAPFSIPDIRNFIPEKVKPWILVVFVLIYQISGGIYLASVSEMRGSLALLQEDIMMAGYASLVGMALTFTIMFRLKFRFSAKNSLIITAIGLIIANQICLHTHSVVVLVLTCFFAGFLRMWGTFACNTIIQLWVTPKRDMSVWFCYIYLLVQGCIQLSGLTSVYVSYLSKWEYMNWLAIGLLLFVVFITFLTFRHYRSMQKLPLFGIDWLGMILWGVITLSIVFVLNYGEHLDWFDSKYIIFATVFAILAIGLNLWRSSFIRHPFIELTTWKYRNVWLTFGLYMIVNILTSPSHYFEHIYAEAILGYDTLNVISLNWAVLFGIVVGAIFCYRYFAIKKWTYKTMTLIGFVLILLYLLIMYFIIDYNLPKETLILPLFVRGVGYIIIAITLITALTIIPFNHFPQNLTIQAFASASIGPLIGSSILIEAFKISSRKNFMILGTNIDKVNPLVNQITKERIYHDLQLQSSILSMKEVFGWLFLFGLLVLLILLTVQSTLRPKSIHPKFGSIRRSIKHQIKRDRLELPEE